MTDHRPDEAGPPAVAQGPYTEAARNIRDAMTDPDPGVLDAITRTLAGRALDDGGRAAQAKLMRVLDGAGESPSETDLLHALGGRDGMTARDWEALSRLPDSGSAKPRPRPMTATEAAKLPRPEKLISASDMDGAVLSIGEICLLAGQGGVGKSALAGEIALAVADPGLPDHHEPRSAGGLLDIHDNGLVLWLAYEETPGEIGARLTALAEALEMPSTCDNVRILDMRGWPLYGPGERHGAAGLYSARPERLEGWQIMADAAAELAPRLIIIDPVLSAYVGEGNAVAPVREFLTALSGLASDCGAGVLALAHSTKAARGRKKAKPDPFDPGQIAGSTAWHDGVRGAMVLDYEYDDDDVPAESGHRRLAISKANMGPARILRTAVPRRKGNGSRWIIGFQNKSGDSWRDSRDHPVAGGDQGAAAPAWTPSKAGYRRSPDKDRQT